MNKLRASLGMDLLPTQEETEAAEEAEMRAREEAILDAARERQALEAAAKQEKYVKCVSLIFTGATLKMNCHIHRAKRRQKLNRQLKGKSLGEVRISSIMLISYDIACKWK